MYFEFLQTTFRVIEFFCFLLTAFKPLNDGKEPTTPDTPVEAKSNGSMSSNYANVTPPPGMCIPFQYMNLKDNNVLTVQPEIHAEPDDDDDDDLLPLPPPPPPPLQEEEHKILNTDCSEDVPDYTNVQVAASEDIARNFGVTLKKLPPPPVPPRTEFSLSSSSAEKVVNE